MVKRVLLKLVPSTHIARVFLLFRGTGNRRPHLSSLSRTISSIGAVGRAVLGIKVGWPRPG